jgi:hypothetical protein
MDDTHEERADAPQMADEEFVFLRQPGGQMTGGGFALQNSFLQHQLAPLTTLGGGDQDEAGGMGGGKGRRVSSPFEHLVVPAGLYLMPGWKGGRGARSGPPLAESLEHVPAPDDLFDRLLGLVQGGGRRPKRTKRKPTSADTSQAAGRRKRTRRHR